MSLLVKFWLLVLFGAAIGVMLSRDNGYVLLAISNYTVEMSLALLILLISALFLAHYLTMYLVSRSLRRRQEIGDQQSRRDWQLAQQAMTRGLLEMAMGNWSGAEKHLTQGIEHSKTPLPNYLTAARAAHRQGAYDRRDRYIGLAEESLPSAAVAIRLTQAELQLAEQQLEPALATLQELQRTAPRDPSVLRLLYRLYAQLGDWEHLRDLLPELRRHEVEDAAELGLLEVRAHRGLLKQASEHGDAKRLRTAWAAVPRALRDNPDLISDFAGLLQAAGQSTEAEKLLSAALRKNWSIELLKSYGQLDSTEPGKKLSQMERFLDQHPDDPELLLMLGQLSLRARLWGKARGYLEACVGRDGPTQAYAELGQLLESLQEPEQAIEVYRRGLSERSESDPVLPPQSTTATAVDRPRSDNQGIQPYGRIHYGQTPSLLGDPSHTGYEGL